MSDLCEWCAGDGCDECQSDPQPMVNNAMTDTLSAAPGGNERRLQCDFCDGDGCGDCNELGYTIIPNETQHENNNNNNPMQYQQHHDSSLAISSLQHTYSAMSNTSFVYQFSDYANGSINGEDYGLGVGNNNNNTSLRLDDYSAIPGKPDFLSSQTSRSISEQEIMQYLTNQIYELASEVDLSMNEAEIILRKFDWNITKLNVYLLHSGIDQLRKEYNLPHVTPEHYNTIYDVPLSYFTYSMPSNNKNPNLEIAALIRNHFKLYNQLTYNNILAKDCVDILQNYNALNTLYQDVLTKIRADLIQSKSNNGGGNNIIASAPHNATTKNSQEVMLDKENNNNNNNNSTTNVSHKQEEYECLACFGDYTRNEIYRFPCGHNVCQNCMPEHLKATLQAVGSGMVSTTTCPGTFLVVGEDNNTKVNDMTDNNNNSNNNNGDDDDDDYHFNNIDTKCHYPLSFGLILDVFQQMDMQQYCPSLVASATNNDVDESIPNLSPSEIQLQASQVVNNNTTNNNNNNNTNNTANLSQQAHQSKQELTQQQMAIASDANFYRHDIKLLDFQPPAGSADTTILFSYQRVETSDRVTLSGRYRRWLVDEFVHIISTTATSSITNSSNPTNSSSNHNSPQGIDLSSANNNNNNNNNNNFKIIPCHSTRSCGLYIFIPAQVLTALQSNNITKYNAPAIPVVEFTYLFSIPENRAFLCPCGVFNCLTCDSIGVHFPAPCDVVQEYNSRTDPDYLSNKMIMAAAKTCPTEGCGVKVMKDKFCNHISCSQCGKHWCWLCKGPWSIHTRNYQCKAGITGKLSDKAQEEQDNTSTAIAETQRIRYYDAFFKQYTNQMDVLLKRYYDMVYLTAREDPIHAVLESLPKFRDGLRQLYITLSVVQWSYAVLFFLQGSNNAEKSLLLRQSQAWSIQYAAKLSSLIINKYLMGGVGLLLDSAEHQKFNNYRISMVNYTENFAKRSVEYNFNDLLKNYDTDIIAKEKMERGISPTAAMVTNNIDHNIELPNRNRLGMNDQQQKYDTNYEGAMNWACTLCQCLHIPEQSDLIFDDQDDAGDDSTGSSGIVDITERTKKYLHDTKLKSQGKWSFMVQEKNKMCRYRGVVKNAHDCVVCANCFACFKHNEIDCRLCYPISG